MENLLSYRFGTMKSHIELIIDMDEYVMHIHIDCNSFKLINNNTVLVNGAIISFGDYRIIRTLMNGDDI